jgi:hypothetical protein
LLFHIVVLSTISADPAVLAKPQVLLSEDEFKVVGYCEENQMRIILRSTSGFDGLVHLGRPNEASCFKDVWGLSQRSVQLSLKYADCKKYAGQVIMLFFLPANNLNDTNCSRFLIPYKIVIYNYCPFMKSS